ncbi:MAG: nodulation protein NodH [Albidovulum sp.]
MARMFQSFVVFAAMRTGSNFLEESLNGVEGVTSHGEAFNPIFIGLPNRNALLGMTMAERDACPQDLFERIRKAPGLNGFRYFPDHDARILDDILDDPNCAKIILNRNPLESYVSLKIARETGQWKARDAQRLKTAKVAFDAAEFQDHFEVLHRFQRRVLSSLQKSGQTAFYLDYADLGDADILTGLLRFLGMEDTAICPATSVVPQNPAPISYKVTNPSEMLEALARQDRFEPDRTPNFEPRRGPMVPGFVASKGAALLFMPMRSGPSARIEAWLAKLGGADRAGLITGFTQSSLRSWMRDHPGGYRSFTVLRHPVARAHTAFCEEILSGARPIVVDQLVRHHRFVLPDTDPDAEFSPKAHRAAFVQFVRFTKASLNGQSALRADPAWASQSAILAGFCEFTAPDLVIREEDLETDLAWLCKKRGVKFTASKAVPDPWAKKLALIYDEDIEALVRQAYGRDYLNFGFGAWAGIE